MKSAEMNVILFDGNDVIATSGDSNLCTITSGELYHVTDKSGVKVYYDTYSYNSASGIWVNCGKGNEKIKNWDDAVKNNWYHSNTAGQAPCTKNHNITQ